MTPLGAGPLEAQDELEITAARLRSEMAADGWSVTVDSSGFWTEYAALQEVPRDAGTKLHVSASVKCAADVLAGTVPILRAHNVGFKHCRNLRILSHLSTGQGGRTQVGKFITVYPPTEPMAAEIAAELHAATIDYRGPAVPNEEAFTDGSLVYSRFGAFTQRWLQLPSGRIVPAVMTGGELTADLRSPSAATSSTSSVQKVLRGRYVRMSRLSESPKGRTHLGIVEEADDVSFVIIKEAFAHTMEDLVGLDATLRLRNEATLLSDIAATGIAPRFVDFWDDRASSFLVYEPIEGPSFAAMIRSLAAQGLRPPLDLLAEWLSSLCDTLHQLHTAGYVSCDVKPENIIMTTDGFRLIDLELAGPPTSEPTGGMGTPGYCSPEQADATAGRSFQDDVFGIGATMLAAATSADASNYTSAEQVAALEHMRAPENKIFAIAARCLHPDRALRYQSVDEIVSALSSHAPDPPDHPADFQPLAVATEIADRIVGQARVRAGAQVFWVSDHHTLNRQPSRDMYAGSSGIALFLCALGGLQGNDEYISLAERCGAWLWDKGPAVPRKEPMPGLYFGEAGPATLYLALFRATQDELWLRRCNAVADRIEAMTIRSPDLMTGLAGVGLFHLMRWHVDGLDRTMASAARCADALIAMREPGRPIWTMPDDFDLLSGAEYLGFAHGTAGIGFFLAEHAAATGDDGSREACQDVADRLIELARPTLAGAGLDWPMTEDAQKTAGPNWCHGSAGFARFLAAAHKATGDRSHREAAMAAAHMTAVSGSWIGTTQCHGLAGNLDVLVDIAQKLDEPAFLDDALRLGENLYTYRMVDGWPSDERSKQCPDFMIGEAGVGAAYLRLAIPTSPHLVSCEAFAG